MPLPRPEARDRHIRVRRVLTGVLIANLAVLGSKLFVGILSGSLAILGGALDSAGGELRSELLLADAAHTRTDVYVTTGVLTGVLLARHGWWWADPAVAIAVALLILWAAYRILARAVPVLVDQRALPPTAIQETAQGVVGVRSAYGIRSRGAAPVRYAEVTIAVDRNANVQEAHAIADAVEERLKRDLQLAEVTVHVEPCC